MNSWTGALICFFIFLVCVCAAFGVEAAGWVILGFVMTLSLVGSVFIAIDKLWEKLK